MCARAKALVLRRQHERMDEIDDASERFSVWEAKARENVQKWGLQDVGQLTLAIAEENAEVGEEVLSNATVDDEIAPLLETAVRDGLSLRDDIEAVFEGDDGTPVDDRPEVTLDSNDIEELQEEIDDLGALVIQLQAALDTVER